MRTIAIIEGLTILEKYRDKPDGFNTGAEYDVIYAYRTDNPVEGADLDRLVELDWIQEDAEYGDEEDFAAKYYDPEESWVCFP